MKYLDSINLKGEYLLKKGYEFQSPEYLRLPEPTHVRSELEDIEDFSINFLNDDIVHWDISWEGVELCNEVIRSVEENIGYWTHMNHIARLIAEDYENERKEKSKLVRISEERIQKWKEILKEIKIQY